ncbi:uncharacterized protein N0V89_008938 [Didymosphaeria variabile]|uniref:FAD-binding domain-containing protein n=1 Tax=Didymosphaeria variabile TaxID=1932322 RepID=A0A9W9C9R4_9PLEO|nr:uncharacterized protein N0V89_008938 [Didymosphaeria variabile]KAJ4350317.1 hypothetical protein N0V89_008938 [Didymosphaeria variabile]
MEDTQVVIVGAGPSGLVLGLTLAMLKIRVVILEKTKGITEDPRGVYLTGDAVRILQDLGIEDDMHKIGHVVDQIIFHQGSITDSPFYAIDVGIKNTLEQVAAQGMLQSQPKLESALRNAVQRIPQWCSLREGCTVVGRSSEDPPIVEYEDDNAQGEKRQIQCQWLVGADGKTGIVRKHFLEPRAGIRQEEGTYTYSGTWVAANLHLTLPTPETHPEFPLWKLNYSSDEVYDLFWPKSWHFCRLNDRATATGRFGPHGDRTWRHEFCLEDEDEGKDSEALLWDCIFPMVTRSVGRRGEAFDKPITYPSDCIRVMRCRPFKFVHKTVNRWFDKRTILIGDAAHVFPPFAGQGIASGVRDAHQLAWRLALLLRSSDSASDRLLQAWALERRSSVDNAAMFSIFNGHLVNKLPNIWIRSVLRLHRSIDAMPLMPKLPDPQRYKEVEGFSKVSEGFHTAELRGGSRLAQIYLQSSINEAPVQSDEIVRPHHSILTLIIMSTKADPSGSQLVQGAQKALDVAGIDPIIISRQSIVVFSPSRPEAMTFGKPADELCANTPPIFWPATNVRLPRRPPVGYDPDAFARRLGSATRYAIVRPDFFCFACVPDANTLGKALEQLRQRTE